jgi:hypothetical protein
VLPAFLVDSHQLITDLANPRPPRAPELKAGHLTLSPLVQKPGFLPNGATVRWSKIRSMRKPAFVVLW